jgi:hypothetical protein
LVSIFNIFKSVIIVCLISTGVAAYAHSVNVNATATFVLATVLQIILYNALRHIRSDRMRIQLRELELREIESLEKQGLELECSHCRATAFVPIRFDEQNTYTCPSCGKVNSLYINVTVARETTPLNIDAVTTRLLIDEEELVKKSIREKSND